MNFSVSNIYLLIYILLWVILFIYHRKRTKEFGVASLVIGFCLVFSIVSFILYNSKSFEGEYGELTLFPFIYLFFMFWLILLPGIKYQKANVMYIQMPSNFFLYLFLFGYAVTSILVIPKSISTLYIGLISLFSDIEVGQEMYLLTRESYVASDRSISGIFGLFSIFHGLFKDIAVFFFFYYLSLKNRKKSYLILYIIVLLVNILISISNGGRTPFVMNLYIIAVGYFIFYYYWDIKTQRIARKIASIMLLLVSIPFIILTISRFGDREDTGGTFGSILSYAGQAPLNFNLYAMDANGIRNGDRTFNEFKSLLGFNVPNDIRSVRFKYRHMNIDDSKFITFVGDFVLDFGPYVALLIFSFFSLLFVYKTKSLGNSISFHRLLLVYFTLVIVLQGAMYLFNYSFMGNWTILTFILVYFGLYFDYKAQTNRKYISKTIE